MANTIPCPNPTCTHQFKAAELQSATQLACPRCGFRMQGKAPAKPAPAKPVAEKPKPAAPPLAKPVAVKSGAPPLAAPIPTAAPPAEPTKPDGALFNPDAGGPLLRTPIKRKKSFNWLRLVLVLLTFGVAGSVVVIGILAVFLGYGFGIGKSGGGADGKGSVFYGQIKGQKDGNEKVFKLVLSKDEWEIDRDVLSRFEAHQAWKHKQMEHDFWFAVVVQDYGPHKPRDAEMLRYGIDKLEAFFSDTLEIEKKAEPAKIKDLAAQKIQFKGQIKSANWLGECYMFFNNGVGYWLFLSSPDWRTIEHFAEEMPKKYFFVESERRGWREQPQPVETFTAVNKKFNATVLKKVWEELRNPKDVEENGVLYLSGRYTKAKDNRKNASLLVFTLKKEDDLKAAMKSARDYLDSKVKNENETYKIALATEVSPGQTEGGASENVGNRPGRILDLKRLAGEEIQRYYFLAVANEADAAYVIVGDCTWDSRQIWRQDFLDAIRSINFTKGD